MARNPKQRSKNRSNKVHLVFDEAKRKDFLTGFHKRKVQRKKYAKEKFEKDLKEERRRLKQEAKKSYEKLVASRRDIPELQTLLKEEYEDENVTVRIEELGMDQIAQENNFLGTNTTRFKTEESDEEQDEEEAVPGMELTEKKKKKVVKQEPKFSSERDVKRLLKKEATKKVQKSKVFQKKNKMEKQKQMKKSRQDKHNRFQQKKKGKSRPQHSRNRVE